MVKKIIVIIIFAFLLITTLTAYRNILAEEKNNYNATHFVFKITGLSSEQDVNKQIAISNEAIESLKEKSDILGIKKVNIYLKDKDIIVISYETSENPRQILEVIQPEKLPIPLVLIAVFQGEYIEI